jgi:hypothetical protein
LQEAELFIMKNIAVRNLNNANYISPSDMTGLNLGALSTSEAGKTLMWILLFNLLAKPNNQGRTGTLVTLQWF